MESGWLKAFWWGAKGGPVPHTDRKPLETPSHAKRKLLRELSLFLFALPSIHNAPQVCFPQAHPTVTPLGPQPYLQVPDKDWVDLISPARLAGSREVCLWCHRQKWSGSCARAPPSTPWAPPWPPPSLLQETPGLGRWSLPPSQSAAATLFPRKIRDDSLWLL